ncbi:hypothetical protein B0H13DRAFT_2382567 [Mycena leptocephala]|nr:hypothetical protein B0H13DRAFT_2382567 [Mycena leptocephala]
MDPESIAAYLEKPNISTSSRSFFQNKLKTMLALRETKQGKGKAKATPAPRKISAVNDDSDYEETIEVDYDAEPAPYLVRLSASISPSTLSRPALLAPRPMLSLSM